MIPRPSSSVPLEKDGSYIPEVWVWYVIGIVVLVIRSSVRLRTVGIKGFKVDDYLIIPFTVLWTFNAVIVQITYYTGGNVDVTPAEALKLSPHDAWVLAFGSVWEFVSWYTYSGVIWTQKLQVLFFYRRLSLDLFKTKAINIITSVTGLAYVALGLTISLSCRPYSDNWRIQPLPGPECTFRPQNFWCLAVLNVVTDILIMSIPFPMLLRLRVPVARKIGVSLLLLSGVFMISTAVVRAVQTLTGAPSVININRWGFRETGVGMIAVNAPILAPLFKKRFWKRGKYQGPRPPSPEPREMRAQRPVKTNIHQWWQSVSSYASSRSKTTVRDDMVIQRTRDEADLESGNLKYCSGQIPEEHQTSITEATGGGIKSPEVVDLENVSSKAPALRD